MKKEFVTIKWSEFPRNAWIRLVFINPSEASVIAIPHKRKYVYYKAYFPSMKEKKLFNICFPYDMFKRAIMAIPQKQRRELTRPVQCELMKTGKFKGRGGDMQIRAWGVL